MVAVAPNDADEGGAIDAEQRKDVTTPEALAITRDLAERAQRDVQRVQERLRSTQAIQRFCAAVYNELEGGHTSEALRLIRGGSKPLALLRDRSPESAAAIEAIGKQLLPTVEEAFAGL